MQLRRAPQREDVPRAGQALVVRPFARAKLQFLWHFHPEVELTWIRRGSGIRYVGRSIEPFQPGDLCLFGPGLPHAYAPAAPGGTGRWIVLQFLPATWGEAFWNLPEHAPLAVLLARATDGLQTRIGDDEPLARAFGALERERDPLRRTARFVELLGEAARRGDWRSLGAGAGPRAQDPRLTRVLRWLEGAVAQPVRQSEAARRAGLSPAAFSRLCQREWGRTFQRQVNELRVARVCHGLEQGTRTVTDLALSAGFANLANFNRRFREITGLTPRAYRERLRQPGGV